MAPKVINIVSVSSDIGSIYAGKSRAPAAFESVGLQEKLRYEGYEVNESHALENDFAGWTASSREPNGARNEARTVETCKKVSKAVASALGDREVPEFQLILSGECLYCPPILSAYWRHFEGTSKRVGLIYVDADCDLYTPKEPNSTGNIAGMTLTHLTLREGALDSMKEFSKPDGSGVVDNSNIVLFGLNMNSQANRQEHLGYLFDNNHRVFTSKTVQRKPTQSAEAALRWMQERVDYIVVHLDVDVIDPGEFPLSNVPSWTGIGYHETMSAIKTFLKSERCIALSLAEVNPDHDPGLKMTKKLVEDIVSGLGSR
ncbi:hypothetical protein N0V90_005853 [Kalmusia sp. IMI 367209]|nr:hypothetical protein N0V90_005853 [Kalmusia sp. IMI 367209]